MHPAHAHGFEKTYLGVHLPRRHVQIVQIIADLMVILVIPLSFLAAKESSLERRLDALGALHLNPG
jgi:hypothetical protein